MNYQAHKTGLRSFIILALLTWLPVSASACDRACIVDHVETYVDALMVHDPSLVEFTDNVRSTENGQDVEIGDGIWQSITARGGYSQIFVDDGLQSAVFFGVFDEGDEPLLLAIRIGFEGERIQELENLASRFDYRNGLISRHQLREPNPVYEIVQPENKRLSRQVLIDAAHAYFDGIANSVDAGVPMHRECNRRENGVLLLQNREPQSQPCPSGFARFNYITDVRDRRIAVVDTARNLVLMWAFFDVPGDIEVEGGRSGPSDIANPDGTPRADTRRLPRSLYIAELFRLEDGLIRDIEAIMFNLDLGSRSGWE